MAHNGSVRKMVSQTGGGVYFAFFVFVFFTGSTWILVELENK